MFGALRSIDGPAADALLEVAADFTPRFELHAPDEVVLDLAGLERLFGGPHAIGEELCRAGAERQLRLRIAIAGTCTAARLLARAESPEPAKGAALDIPPEPLAGCQSLLACSARLGPLCRSQRIRNSRNEPHSGPEDVAVVEPGAEAIALAPLSIDLLTVIENAEPAPSHPRTLAPSHLVVSTFRRWGIRTLGELAALPVDGVAARLGVRGTCWQRLARGEDPRPLRPEVPKERFEQALDLEWPIDGLEPLSFVLGRLLEPLTTHLERRGRGAAVLHARLHLVTRAIHERSLQLPAPMRDARTFRTLLLLDLESHPPSAAIDRVVVAVDPTPARIVQFSLLTRPIPSPEQLSTLTARLAALMGEDRCGSPVVVDSWQPGVFAMKPFNPGSGIGDQGSGRIPDAQCPRIALRRFRIPVPARVRMEHDKPQHVSIDRAAVHLGSRITDPIGSRIAAPGSQLGGCVQACAGPWRTSGHWWCDRARMSVKNARHDAGYALQAADAQSYREPTTSLGLCVSVARNRCEEWDRDEWDVTLSDGATYRIFRERATHAWFVDGSYD
jgi:protein ImuB